MKGTVRVRDTERSHPVCRAAAFTLVELLVVVAIIALLVAIMMPAVARVRVSAQGAVCRSNLRNIGQAMYGYVGDNDGWLPFWGDPRDFGWPPGKSAGGAGLPSGGAQWDIQIMPYLGINWEWGSSSPPPELGLRPTVFYCPAGRPFSYAHQVEPRHDFPLNYVRSNSYNYNQRIGENIRGSRSLERLEDPQHTLLVLDAALFNPYTGLFYAAASLGRHAAGSVRVTESSVLFRASYDRHDEHTHVLFAAGQVEARPQAPSGHPAGVRFGNGYPLYKWP